MDIIALHRLSVIAAIMAPLAAAQSTGGSIQGTVVGSDGTPLSSARVYAAVKAASQKSKAPPTLVTRVSQVADTRSDGKMPNPSPVNSFVITGLPAGAYVLCAQTTVGGWLDPCHWSATLSLVNLASGQNLTNQMVVMTRGAILQIRINDPAKLLAARPGAIAHDVQVKALASNNSYYDARVVSTDAGGRNHEVTLPFDMSHTLIVRSQQFALADSKGLPVAAAGWAEPLQVSTGTAAPQFTFTVNGKSH